MHCTRCGPDWEASFVRCPICNDRLVQEPAPPIDGAAPLARGQPVRAQPDLSAFDPWADDEDGPSLGGATTAFGRAPGWAETPSKTPSAPPPEEDEPTADEARLLALINAARATPGHECPGAGPLTWHVGAARVARAHSRDMLARGFFAHDNPDGEGPADRLRRGGVGYRNCAENLALHPSMESAHHAFMGEPPGQPNHRANVLNPAFSQVGIGIIRRPDGMLLITENYVGH